MSASTVEVEVGGLLFDMDGVLISSIGSVERSWKRYAQMRGLDPEMASRVAHGRRAIETLQDLCPSLDAGAELRIIEQIEVDDNEGLMVFPGVRELLRSLPRHAWALVTSATERLALSRLAHAGIALPEHFVTAEMVTEGKPHPAPYLRGAQMLGLGPEDCVVIEDAPAGVASGKAAGCRVLAVLSTHAPGALQAADWRIAALADLHVAVQGQRLRLTFTPQS
ncbi:MAG: HAD-IA family hydrolase [Acidobacteriaceae bacterium]